MKNNEYLSQLKEFYSYMEACFEVLMAYGDFEDTNSFYRSDFEITFRGRKVTLANGATVFQMIEELIATEIDENEEA